MAFVAAQDERWSDGGLAILSIELVVSEKGRAVVQRRCPWAERRQSESCGSGGQSDTLLSGVTDMTLTYYDGETHSWSGRWARRKRMPDLVKVKLDKGGIAAERVIALPRAAELHCGDGEKYSEC